MAFIFRVLADLGPALCSRGRFVLLLLIFWTNETEATVLNKNQQQLVRHVIHFHSVWNAKKPSRCSLNFLRSHLYTHTQHSMHDQIKSNQTKSDHNAQSCSLKPIYTKGKNKNEKTKLQMSAG